MSCTAIKIHLFRPMKSTEKAEFHLKLYIKIKEFRKEHSTSPPPVKRTKKKKAKKQQQNLKAAAQKQILLPMPFCTAQSPMHWKWGQILLFKPWC